MKSFAVFCVVLLALSSLAKAQESQFPAYFEGSWTNSLTGGTLSFCVDGNAVFGGFNVGFLTSFLSPDRRTISGVMYMAGNTGVFDEAEFKVSLTGDNQGFVGTLVVNGVVRGWSETKISSAPPHLAIDCYAPDRHFGSTIEGEWETGQGEKMNLCLNPDGLTYAASFGDSYHTGPVLPFGKGGRAAYWSPLEYGGSIVRLIGENQLTLSSHTLDLTEVLEHKCGNGPTCRSGLTFRRSGVTSPSKCAANAHLSVWNGWFTFTPMDGQLVFRRAGTHVYGSTRYGVFEGIVDPANPLHMTGIWYDAAWKFTSPGKSRYFGTFDIKLADDLTSFRGELTGNPNGGDFTYEWIERRLEGRDRQPTADETFSISELSDADSRRGLDGVWIPTYNTNVRFYFCSVWQDDDDDDVQQDKYGRQEWLGSYTDPGCGRVAGGIRGELELAGFPTTEPFQTSSNGIWVDDSGFGTQIQRRITDVHLREEWFAGAFASQPPALNFCDPLTQIKCGRIDYLLDVDTPVTQEDCLHCYNSAAQMSAISLLILLLIALLTMV